MRSTINNYCNVICRATLLPLLFAFTLLSGQLQAQGAAAGNLITVTGQIAVVNRENRTLTIIDGQGGARTISVPEDARNFDQIKRGDTMTVGYLESIEIFLAEPGTAPAVEETVNAARAEKGDMPAGIIEQAVQVSAKITAIDKEKRVLTLLTEDGSQVEKEVAPEVAAFDALKVGDTIAVRISRVLSVDVSRPQVEE